MTPKLPSPALVQRYYKAIAALIGPAVILFIADLPGGITQGEWIEIATAALGTSALTAVFPANKTKR